MADKSKSFAGVDNAFAGLFKGFDAGAFAAIQQRNLEAFARTAGIIATATTRIAEKQLEMFKSASEVRAGMPALREGENLTDVVESQIATGRDNLVKAFQQVNEVSEAVRQCYVDIADELQGCAQDNWRSVQGQAGNIPERPTASVTQAKRAATA